jgi:hypothetical protein
MEESMMPHFFQKAQPVENRWLLPILAAVSLVATVDPASLAEATECPVTEADGAIPRTARGNGIPSSILPLTMTTEQDIFGAFVLFPVREVAPYMKNSRIALSDTKNQGSVTRGACLNQDVLKSELFNQAMFESIGKFRANVRTQSMKVSVLPYNGKRQALTIRTTLPEVGVSTRSKIATISGPAQEIQNPILSDEHSVRQVVTGLSSTVESPSQFGSQSLVELNPFASVSQLPDNESLRMNRATAQALPGGNCASGCP